MRADRVWSAVRNVLAVGIPLAAAIALAYQLSLHDQRNRVQLMADVVLNRSELVTGQLQSAFERLAVFEPAQACSRASIALMREADLSSSLLQGLGYVENNRLMCSSLGEAAALDVGLPDYVSATGAIIRSNRVLPIAPGTQLLLVSTASGYTGLVHPGLVFSLIGESEDLTAGTVGYSTREYIIRSGPAIFDWNGADMPEGQYAGTFFSGDQLFAWRRSARWDQFSYATVPAAAVGAQFQNTVGVYLAAGLLAGFAALLLMRRLEASRTSLPALFKAGLARNEVFTVYQPIVDMRSGRWIGAEVLARWQRPSGEWISPDVFVPIAEKNGLIRQLTRHVMARCAEDLKGFLEMEPDFFLSVNVTSMDLQDPEFPGQLITACDASNIAHRRIHLEITERTEVDPTCEAQNIRRLREQGFEIGIDDFGIGYSNLAYLDTLTVDYIKIDKAFVAGISNGAIGSAVIDHIIALGTTRGLKIIAEGVEEDQQRADLVSRGVWLGQGWLFAKPMPRAILVAAYAANRLAAAPKTPPLARVA